MPVTQPTMEEVAKLFEAELHLGHKRNRLHPKARKYVYRIENGTSIIDPSKTMDALFKEVVLKFGENIKIGRILRWKLAE